MDKQQFAAIPKACSEARRGLPSENFKLLNEEIAERKTVLTAKPISLALRLEGRGCNLNCLMCGYPELNDEKRPDQIALGKVISILEECLPYALGLQTAGTEPLIYREEYGRLCEVAEHYPNVLMQLCTNGLLLTDYWKDRLNGGNFNRVAISIDAATRETYRMIRGADVFDKVVRNVSNFANSRNGEWPSLQFNFIAMRANVNEMVPFVKLVHEMGGSTINFQTLSVDPFYLPPHKLERTKAQSYYGDIEFSKRVLQAEADARILASELGIEVVGNVRSTIFYHSSSLNDCRQSPGLDETGLAEDHNLPDNGGDSIFPVDRQFFCTLPFTNLNIDPNGTRFCCWTTPRFRKQENISLESLNDLWNGPMYQGARQAFYDQKPRLVCRAGCRHVPNGGYIHGRLKNGVSRYFEARHETV